MRCFALLCIDTFHSLRFVFPRVANNWTPWPRSRPASLTQLKLRGQTPGRVPSNRPPLPLAIQQDAPSAITLRTSTIRSSHASTAASASIHRVIDPVRSTRKYLFSHSPALPSALPLSRQARPAQVSKCPSCTSRTFDPLAVRLYFGHLHAHLVTSASEHKRR